MALASFGSLAPASAMPTASIQLTASAGADAGRDVIQVKQRRYMYNKHSSAGAYTYRGGGRGHHGGDNWQRGGRHGSYQRYYRHGRYHNRNYYHRSNNTGIAIGIGALAAGAILAAPHGSSGWSAECARKYGSFDRRSGTYLGYDGRRHRCVLP